MDCVRRSHVCTYICYWSVIVKCCIDLLILCWYLSLAIKCGVRAAKSEILDIFLHPLLHYRYIKITTRSRIANMRKFDLKTATAIQKNFDKKKLSEVYSNIKENEQDLTEKIITLAGARQKEMKKVKNQLKEMLPILKPSEVKRFNIHFHFQNKKMYALSLLLWLRAILI